MNYYVCKDGFKPFSHEPMSVYAGLDKAVGKNPIPVNLAELSAMVTSDNIIFKSADITLEEVKQRYPYAEPSVYPLNLMKSVAQLFAVGNLKRVIMVYSIEYSPNNEESFFGIHAKDGMYQVYMLKLNLDDVQAGILAYERGTIIDQFLAEN